MTETVLVDRPDTIELGLDTDLMSLAAVIAAEYDISPEMAVREIEDLYVAAAEAEHGAGYRFWASVKRDGTVEVAQVLKVVATLRDEQREVAIDALRTVEPEAQLGQYVVNPIDPIHPARIAVWLEKGKTEVRNVKLSVAGTDS